MVLINCISGIIKVWNGMSIVAIKAIKINVLNLLFVRTSIQAVMEDKITMKMTETIVT